MSYNNVGKRWKTNEFKEYLKTLEKPKWIKGITIHHTGMPTLSLRENGLTPQHILNIKGFYQTKKWKSGPHLFIDDFYISGMTPLNENGVHAVSFNKDYLGIEVLGNYDFESPFDNRGKICWENTAKVVYELCEWLDIEPNENTIKFHRDDSKTNKSCPGNLVKKDWFLKLVASYEMKSLPPPPKKDIIKTEKKPFWKNLIEKLFCFSLF